MAALEVLEHGTIYRNPCPQKVSEYVAFPAIRALPDDTLLCMCRHGSVRESTDGRVLIHRSVDGGRTWSRAGPLPAPEGLAAKGWRIGAGFGITTEAQVVALVAYPHEGQVGGDSEPDMKLWYAHSTDAGLSWTSLATIDMAPFPGVGPGGNLVTLSDGTLVAAAETGKQDRRTGGWQWSSLVTRSSNGGHTWEPLTKVHPATDEIFFFDMRIAALSDGRILAAYWTHNMADKQDLNVHTAWSSDGGQTWTEPQDAGFYGQVTVPWGQASGRVVAVTNHRRDPHGIRALLSEDHGRTFDEAHHVELWGTQPAVVRSAPAMVASHDTDRDALTAYHHFTFGTPSVSQLSDGTIVAAFYVSEQNVTYVRCCRMVEKD